MGKGYFEVPVGRYYLGDAGYTNSDIIFTPYRGVRYHLNESLRAQQRPQNMKELFNLRHAQLRNDIERIFGIVKRRFPILTKRFEAPFITPQRKLVYACLGLHNFIRKNTDGEDDYDIFDSEGMEQGDRDARENARASNRGEISSITQRTLMDRERDCIAEDMWIQYTGIISA